MRASEQNHIVQSPTGHNTHGQNPTGQSGQNPTKTGLFLLFYLSCAAFDI